MIYSIKNSSSFRLTFSVALAEHTGRPAGRIRKLQLDLLYHEALKLAWGQQWAATGAEVNTIKNHATGVYKRCLNRILAFALASNNNHRKIDARQAGQRLVRIWKCTCKDI